MWIKHVCNQLPLVTFAWQCSDKFGCIHKHTRSDKFYGPIRFHLKWYEPFVNHCVILEAIHITWLSRPLESRMKSFGWFWRHWCTLEFFCIQFHSKLFDANHFHLNWSVLIWLHLNTFEFILTHLTHNRIFVSIDSPWCITSSKFLSRPLMIDAGGSGTSIGDGPECQSPH